MTTATRLLNLLSLLQTGRDWPGSALAARLHVSERTARRDIERLREMGYNIEAVMGPDGGYCLKPGSALPPLLFDDDQTLAVALALRAAPKLGPWMEEAATRALGTVRQVLPSRLRRRLDTLEVTAITRPNEASPADISPDVFVTLASTIRDHETLYFDYTPNNISADNAPELRPPRRVEPHHLVTTQGRCYLVGWDLDRDDWRIFRVDRIHPRFPHGRRFTPRTVPGGDVTSFVSARFKGANVNAWPCRGTVVVALPAHEVLPFAGDATVTAVGDGACTLEAGSWSWRALAAFFGRFDAPMQVVGPPELAAAFTTLAERYAEAGRRQGQPPTG